MTVIQKKRKYASADEQQADAAEDFGQKYHCDSCQTDITNMIRIRCAECPDFDLCLDCFARGVELGGHRNIHCYRIMEMLDFSIFDDEWDAEEELMLVEGLELFGLGNWDQISEHIGTKNKLECAKHYNEIYIQSATWPSPTPSRSFSGMQRRVGPKERKPALTQKANRSTAMSSQPANHEIAGYMPGRMEFDAEYDNEAEQIVKDMVFEDADLPEDMEFKCTILNIYNGVLDRRMERKKFMFERKLLNFRQIQAAEKKRPKEEKELAAKMRVYAKMQTADDFETLMDGLNNEMRLKQRIAQLQEYRRAGITAYKEAAEYEKDKLARTTSYKTMTRDLFLDRTPSRHSARSRVDDIKGESFLVPSRTGTPARGNSVPGSPNAALVPPAQSPTSAAGRRPATPLDITASEGVDLLTPPEKALCSHLRILPKAYMVIKETILREYEARNGKLKKRQARELIKIDVNKTGKIFDFFVDNGWIKS
ncbi:uncharacterized protein BJ171DRAFT_292331 [Polychytrium aggregatum]|uniref:uncharacterized protein n=1 Tax=Polychytrium aggregatum TaxID=110093 RepID=UPI0022FE908E|nr:uncharacterized protein BJ171DRAFT_292331 [Polychytrium aggregatum]KAI9207154.1 hypothetical protein BJ171DRAFT_292331 [Polychytrium aggregatum]